MWEVVSWRLCREDGISVICAAVPRGERDMSAALLRVKSVSLPRVILTPVTHFDGSRARLLIILLYPDVSVAFGSTPT